MGTRSITHIKSGDAQSATICTIYRQFDGYPSGMGADIKKALGERELVNGFSNAKTQINGMADAAALLVAAVKEPGKAGNIYIFSPDTHDMGEEFVYTLYEADNRVCLGCIDVYGDRLLYSGPLDDFDPDQY